jgi:hypothetical protein
LIAYCLAWLLPLFTQENPQPKIAGGVEKKALWDVAIPFERTLPTEAAIASIGPPAKVAQNPLWTPR